MTPTAVPIVTPLPVPSSEAATALPYPGDAPPALVAVADRLFDGAQLLTRVADAAVAAHGALPGVWRGAAAGVGTAELDRVRAALDDATGRLYRARGALLTAADRLTALRATIDVLRHDWCRAEGSVRALDALLPGAVDPATHTLLQDLRAAACVRRGLAVTGGATARAEADETTAGCAAALASSLSGPPVFRPGRGVVPGDLGAALGTDRLTSDDFFRAALRYLPDDETRWAALGVPAQALALATAGALPPPTAGPAGRAAWWRNRSSAEQQAVLRADPQAVGAADGLPAAARHQANLLALDRWDAELVAAIAAVGAEGAAPSSLVREMLVAGFQRTRDTITAVRSQLAVPRSQPVFLLSVEPAGRGRVVVAIGDPDTAANVATYVPGTGSDIGSLGAELDRADAWSAGAAEVGTFDVSTIAWIGYESPAWLPEAGFDAYADAAAPALGAFQLGLRASHQGAPSRNTVIGHSYAGMVIAAAASDGRSLAADQVVLVASTGLEVESVRDLRLDGVAPEDMPGRVFAIEHANDAIRLSGPAHGGNPYTADFGASVMITPPVHRLPEMAYIVPGLGGMAGVADSFAGHGEYQDAGSVEQRLVSTIIVGAPLPVR